MATYQNMGLMIPPPISNNFQNWMLNQTLQGNVNPQNTFQVLNPISNQYADRSQPDYDYQSYYNALQYAPHQIGLDPLHLGMQVKADGLHYPDLFKLPNHSTFSNQSIYAQQYPSLAGHWSPEMQMGNQYNTQYYPSSYGLLNGKVPTNENWQ